LLWLVFPYVFLSLYLSRKRLSDDLTRLSAYHLTVLAVGTSLISSAGAQLLFFLEKKPVYSLLQSAWSMSIGDISGILVTLLFVAAARRTFVR
jgi:hypothetical protein